MDAETQAKIDKLRAEREQVNSDIEKMRRRVRDMSRQIRAMEGPIPDRAGRPRGGASFSIRKA